MENESNGYHISFFKPTTSRARHNRNMVIWLVSVWFIAIFGFHIVLRIIEKPTPEPAYKSFETAWSNIKSGDPSARDFIDLGNSTLSVLGKMYVTDDDRNILSEVFSWSVYRIIPEISEAELRNDIRAFREKQEEITNISEPEYIEQKQALSKKVAPLFDLASNDVRRRIIPFELKERESDLLSEEIKTQVPEIMGKYLIHNQSVLTDFKFLGFPFHYFYTAVFLLILFVGLCWIYCVRTDAMNKKLEIAD